MTPGILACSVRGCGEALTRHDRTFRCRNGHTFDIARSGYLNLLQPQDRRSASAGDSAASVDARGRLLARGVGASIMAAIVSRASSLDLPPEPAVADIGCGGGDALAALAARRPIHGVGIDLSAAAIARAAKQPGGLTWVVANADRRLPLRDGSVHLLLSLHARRNPAECARVLAPGGLLLVAIPAPEDLIELRERVQGTWIARDRAQAVVDEHAGAFALRSRSCEREHHSLDQGLLRDLLTGTYRGARSREQTRVSMLETLDVTLASEVLVFLRSAA